MIEFVQLSTVFVGGLVVIPTLAAGVSILLMPREEWKAAQKPNPAE